MVSLTMPLFVSVSDVITRMQLSEDLQGISDVIESGIIGAQLHVQRVVDGELIRRARTAYFYLDSESFSGIQPGGAYRVEVPSGFIREDEDLTVSVTAANTLTNEVSQFGAYEAIDDTLMRVDYKRGYLHIDANTYSDTYVKVECVTGFEGGETPYPTTGVSDWSAGTAYAVGDLAVVGGVVYECIASTTPGQPVTDATKWAAKYSAIEQLPNDVYEAVMSMVPVIFDNSQATNRSEEAQKQYRRAADHALYLLGPYVRTRGFSFRQL